ncbi:hypothetical protein [Burkholderia sp. Z1]|uniref:hypothetical protein n=1 Tax=Burkholderia TaxID=32008 RepID=UPI0013E91929
MPRILRANEQARFGAALSRLAQRPNRIRAPLTSAVRPAPYTATAALAIGPESIDLTRVSYAGQRDGQVWRDPDARPPYIVRYRCVDSRGSSCWLPSCCIFHSLIARRRWAGDISRYSFIIVRNSLRDFSDSVANSINSANIFPK